jgi:hypothetical protein
MVAVLKLNSLLSKCWPTGSINILRFMLLEFLFIKRTRVVIDETQIRYFNWPCLHIRSERRIIETIRASHTRLTK